MHAVRSGPSRYIFSRFISFLQHRHFHYFKPCAAVFFQLTIPARVHTTIIRHISSKQWLQNFETVCNVSLPCVTYIKKGKRDIAIVGERHDTKQSSLLSIKGIRAAADKEIAYFTELPKPPSELAFLYNNKLKGYNFYLEDKAFRFLVDTSYFSHMIGTQTIPHFSSIYKQTEKSDFFSWSATYFTEIFAHYPEMKEIFEEVTEYSQKNESRNLVTLGKWHFRRLFFGSYNDSSPLDLFSPHQCYLVSLSANLMNGLLKVPMEVFSSSFANLNRLLDRIATPRIYHILLRMITLVALEKIHKKKPLPKPIYEAFKKITSEKCAKSDYTETVLIQDDYMETVIISARNEIFINNMLIELDSVPVDIPAIIVVGENHREGMTEIIEKIINNEKVSLLMSSDWISYLHELNKHE